jgi:hypothetical protein
MEERDGGIGRHGCALMRLGPQSVFEQSGILKEIDLDLAVGPERKGHARCEQFFDGRRSGAQVAFRRRTGADGCLRGSQHSNFLVRDVNGMDCGEALFQKSELGQHGDGRGAVQGEAGFIVCDLLGNRNMQAHAMGMRKAARRL